MGKEDSTDFDRYRHVHGVHNDVRTFDILPAHPGSPDNNRRGDFCLDIEHHHNSADTVQSKDDRTGDVCLQPLAPNDDTGLVPGCMDRRNCWQYANDDCRHRYLPGITPDADIYVERAAETVVESFHPKTEAEMFTVNN